MHDPFDAREQDDLNAWLREAIANMPPLDGPSLMTEYHPEAIVVGAYAQAWTHVRDVAHAELTDRQARRLADAAQDAGVTPEQFGLWVVRGDGGCALHAWRRGDQHPYEIDGDLSASSADAS